MTTDGETWGRRYNEAARDLMLCESKLRDAEAEVRALTARLDALSAFSLDDEGDFTWLMYEHSDGVRCAVTQIDCAPVLETLTFLLRAATADPTPQTETP